MTEMLPATNRFKTLVLVLTLLNTIFAAVLSGLQVDANIRANDANRDSQYYALLVSNELIREGQQGAYDMKLLTTIIKDTQQALVMNFTALELEQAGNDASTAELEIQSQVAQARADAGISFSRFYSDPRYAPTEEGGMPILDTYLADQFQVSNELLAKQNTAADDYQKWNRKADAYVAVLTILAVTFFLLGLAQSSERMRLFFAVSALVITLGAVLWTGFIIIA
jgi:hypothetical protein